MGFRYSTDVFGNSKVGNQHGDGHAQQHERDLQPPALFVLSMLDLLFLFSFLVFVDTFLNHVVCLFQWHDRWSLVSRHVVLHIRVAIAAREYLREECINCNVEKLQKRFHDAAQIGIFL